MQNSLFVEGVDFFATAKKDQGIVGRRSQMFFRRDLAVYCRHYPGTSCHPFCKKGNSDRELACRHYLGTSCHPFCKKGNSDRELACRHYPGTSCHLFCKKGNSDRELACRHYLGTSCHPFCRRGILPINVFLIFLKSNKLIAQKKLQSINRWRW